MKNVPVILLSYTSCNGLTTTTYYQMREDEYFVAVYRSNPNCRSSVEECDFEGIIKDMTDIPFTYRKDDDYDPYFCDGLYTIQFIDHDFKDILISRLLNPTSEDDIDGFKYARNRIVDYITKE